MNAAPTGQPTRQPSSHPSRQPSQQPTVQVLFFLFYHSYSIECCYTICYYHLTTIILSYYFLPSFLFFFVCRLLTSYSSSLFLSISTQYCTTSHQFNQAVNHRQCQLDRQVNLRDSLLHRYNSIPIIWPRQSIVQIVLSYAFVFYICPKEAHT